MSNLLLEKIYPKFGPNSRSEFVTTFTGTHYSGGLSDNNPKKIINTINEKLKACPRSAFIFDEIENFPPGFLNFLSGYVNSGFGSDGIQHNKAIFILLG